MKKNVLITGGSNGIGAATAILFAQNGYNVIINYNNSRQAAVLLQQSLTENGCNVIATRADVRERAQVEKMFETAFREFGTIDILINNAGIAQQKLFTDISNFDWENMLATNLTGVFNCCQAVLPSMIRKKSGSIVNVSSIWGETGGSCEVHYSAAKAGVIGLTKALAKEVGPSGIRVNCVAPGVIKTNMTSGFSIEDLTALAKETPLGRLGTGEDVANAIYFLSTSDSDFLTGQVISPNGGLYI
ncbi:MAG: SDR family oxidoreductase [Oscillospiraceae bacterium]